MKNCLVGYSGFVGSTLLKQHGFDALFRSTNIDQIHDEAYDVVVCAAAPAQKWIANSQPDNDRANIEALIGHLEQVECEKFILISTVDVFANPAGVDENTDVMEEGLHPYGLHRRILEKFVAGRFPKHLIVRLPGLVGPGLRKNIIFDFLNDNNLAAIESRGIFQFYPMINLWYDIQTALREDLSLIHLTAEPVSVADIARLCFNMEFEQHLTKSPAMYDMRSCYADLFGGQGHYQYSRRETLQAIRAYAQSEPRSLKGKDTAL